MSAEKLIITNDDVANARPSPAPSYSTATPAAPISMPPPHSMAGDKQTLVFVGLTAGLLLAIAGTAFLFVRNPELAGSGSSSSKETQTAAAILRVLKADKAAGERHTGSIPQNATASQVANAIATYCEAATNIDTPGCPADFKVAYRHHISAWRDVQGAFQQLPEGFLDGVLMGALNLYLQGEVDGGISRMQGAIQEGMQQVESTWHDVERIAASHDVAL